MNKLEYLKKIEKNLRLPADIKKDVLSELESHINEAQIKKDIENYFGDPNELSNNINISKLNNIFEILKLKSTWIIIMRIMMVATLLFVSLSILGVILNSFIYWASYNFFFRISNQFIFHELNYNFFYFLSFIIGISIFFVTFNDFVTRMQSEKQRKFFSIVFFIIILTIGLLISTFQIIQNEFDIFYLKGLVDCLLLYSYLMLIIEVKRAIGARINTLKPDKYKVINWFRKNIFFTCISAIIFIIISSIFYIDSQIGIKIDSIVASGFGEICSNSDTTSIYNSKLSNNLKNEYTIEEFNYSMQIFKDTFCDEIIKREGIEAYLNGWKIEAEEQKEYFIVFKENQVEFEFKIIKKNDSVNNFTIEELNIKEN